jgi:hypothetical protein
MADEIYFDINYPFHCLVLFSIIIFRDSLDHFDLFT